MLDDINEGFQRIMRSNEPVRFTNTYHGMPVTYTGRVLSCEGGQVTFNVPRIQIVCMQQTRITYLRSNLLPHTLRAHAFMWNMRDELVILERFERTSDTIGSRSLVRVEPRQVIHGDMISGNEGITYGVNITELSVRGLTCRLPSQVYDLNDLGKGERVVLVFPLTVPGSISQTPNTISSKGLIRNVIIEENQTHRLGIQIFPTITAEQTMTRYISMRQSDLLKELRKSSTDDLLL